MLRNIKRAVGDGRAWAEAMPESLRRHRLTRYGEQIVSCIRDAARAVPNEHATDGAKLLCQPFLRRLVSAARAIYAGAPSQKLGTYLMKLHFMSAIRDIIVDREVPIFFGFMKCRGVRRHEESESSSMNRKFASLYVAGLWLGVAGTALAQVPNPPTDFSIEGGTSVPTQPGRTLFFDDFEYDASRSGNVSSIFTSNGWNHIKSENSAEASGNGWIYTRQDASLGSRVLVLESRPGPVPIQGMPYSQTDYYLQLGREGSTTQVLPANVWIQFWSYATPESRFSTRDKTLYPCSGYYPCNWGPNLGWLFMWGSGGFNTTGDGSSRRFLAVEAQNADNRGADEYPTNKAKLGQNLVTTPLAGGRWYQIRLHFDTSGAQGTYEAWVRERGQSAWTKVSDWRGGVTPNFSWPIPTDQRRGHVMFRAPTTVNGMGDSTVYVDDFAIATSQDNLPQ